MIARRMDRDPPRRQAVTKAEAERARARRLERLPDVVQALVRANKVKLEDAEAAAAGLL